MTLEIQLVSGTWFAEEYQDFLDLPHVKQAIRLINEGHAHLLKHEISIGRSPENEIRLDDSTVSWKHAKLTQENGRWYITDIGSRYGTTRFRGRKPFMLLPLQKEEFLPEDTYRFGKETMIYVPSAEAKIQQTLSNSIPAPQPF